VTNLQAGKAISSVRAIRFGCTSNEYHQLRRREFDGVAGDVESLGLGHSLGAFLVACDGDHIGARRGDVSAAIGNRHAKQFGVDGVERLSKAPR